MTTFETDPRLIQDAEGMRGLATGLTRRLRSGELGQLPVVIGLAVIWGYFWSQEAAFLSSRNLTNLILQIAAVGTMSIGIVLVLLLGEIDLSIGSVSGATSALMAVYNVRHGWNPLTAILLALAAGAVIGAIHGFFITRVKVPAFVVTLAGLIGWQGFQLQVLGKLGSINLPPSLITDLTSYYFPKAVGWAIALVLIALYVGAQLLERRTRIGHGLAPRPTAEIGLRSFVVGGGTLAAVAILNAHLGVPLAAVIFVGLVVVFDLLMRKTRYGRHVYAVGGNAEAARRAGINVNRIRLSVFALCSTFAALGGILFAARSLSVATSSGSGDTTLNAIAAAVIGGTSLFGGRGRVSSALLGALVIGSISNGMDLLGKSSPIKLMITGAVLLTAVTIDAASRRGRQAHGRA